MSGPFKMKGFPVQQGTASYKSATPYQSAFKALDDEGNWHYLSKERPELHSLLKGTTNISEAKKIVKDHGLRWKTFNDKYQIPRRDALTGEFLTDWSGKTLKKEEEPVERKTIKGSVQSIKEGAQLVKEKKAEFFENNPDATKIEWLKYKQENMKNW